MYQLNFSEQSMAVLNRLEKWDQMPIIEKFSTLSPKDLEQLSDDLGRFSRNGKTYYRLRASEHRIYFEVQGDSLFSHYILHQHSFSDFVFRFKLPFKDDQAIEEHQSLWQYLESLKK